jgi:hypothetical protein
MSLFVLHLHKVASYPALYGGNRYLQVRHHQAYVVGPVLKGRLGKWMFALSEFDIRYQPVKAVKGQALADLITERINTNIATLSVRHGLCILMDQLVKMDVA